MVIHFPLYAEESFRGKWGGSTETFQTRYVDRKESHFSGIWAEGSMYGVDAMWESRGDRSLGSLRYTGDYFSFSAGHRYKTIPGFFWGRDPRIYSTLTKDQPIQKSYFFSLFPGYVSPGVFWLEEISGKNAPGLSLVLPDKEWAFTYSDKTGVRSVYTRIRNKKWKPLTALPSLLWTLQGEALGTTRNYFGRYFFQLREKEWDGWMIQARFYKDKDGALFESPDDFLGNIPEGIGNPTNPFVSWTSIKWGPYHMLEGFDSHEPGKRIRYGGIRMGILPLPGGRVGLRHRTYEERFYWEEEKNVKRILGHSLLWMGADKKWNYWVGREFRNNGDSFTEAGVDWKGNGWVFRTSLVSQKEGNAFPVPVERYTGEDRPDISLSDRKTVVRLRFNNKNLDWNATFSERMGRRGNLFFMNLQFVAEF